MDSGNSPSRETRKPGSRTLLLKLRLVEAKGCFYRKALLMEMFFGTSVCLWRTHGRPGTAGISTQGERGSRTHVRDTEQKMLKPSQIYES